MGSLVRCRKCKCGQPVLGYQLREERPALVIEQDRTVQMLFEDQAREIFLR